MIRPTRIVCCFVGFLLFLTPSHAQQTSAVGHSGAGAYPDSSEGLQNQLQDILQAVKAKDRTKENALIGALIMPEGSTWFEDEFGPAFGPRLAAAYRKMLLGLTQKMQTVYENNIKRGWLKPKIFRYADAAGAEAPIDNFLNCMDEVVPLYQTAFFHDRTGYELSAPDASGRMEIAAGDLDGYYVSVKGTFRFVPQQVLLMLPKERPVRIQLDMNVMRSKITNRLEWAYPEEAVKRHIKGDVVIRLVLNTNGKIKEIKPVEGPPILSDAVLQAAKQWTFEPTTLDGEQVEVEITLKAVFGFSMTR